LIKAQEQPKRGVDQL